MSTEPSTGMTNEEPANSPERRLHDIYTWVQVESGYEVARKLYRQEAEIRRLQGQLLAFEYQIKIDNAVIDQHYKQRELADKLLEKAKVIHDSLFADEDLFLLGEAIEAYEATRESAEESAG